MGDLGVESDAYFVAPSPTLYVMGAAFTDFVTLVEAQPVAPNPSVAAIKPIKTSFAFTITNTLIFVFSFRRVTLETCLGQIV